MPNKPPSDRMRAKGGPPSPEFCPGAPGQNSGFSPIMRNEPNLHPFQAHHAGRRPVPTCRGTQFHKANNQEMRNEPNFIPLVPQFGETNPICERFLRSKPNLPYRHPPHDPITRNEPNPRPPHNRILQNEPNLPFRQPHTATFFAKRTQFPNTRCPTTQPPPPKNAKRTQFAPAAISLCATRSYGSKKGGAGKSLYNNNLGEFKASS